jgi:hypothetical protein
MRTVTTRDVFLRRMSPTCIATSHGQRLSDLISRSVVYIMPIVKLVFGHIGSPENGSYVDVS